MTRLAEDIAEIKVNVAETKTDMRWVKNTLKLHISHHHQVRLAMIGSLIAAGTAILIAIL